MKSVMLQLRPEQLEQLDAEARRSGKSRSQLVREAVDAMFAPKFDHDVAELYAKAYPDRRFGVDEWGDLDAWHDAAAAERRTWDRESW